MSSALTMEKVKEFLQDGNDFALHILSLILSTTTEEQANAEGLR